MGARGGQSAQEEEWARVVATLDQDPADAFNMAHECCDRWAGERGRLALVVRHPDGHSERWTYFELARVAGILSRQVEAWTAALGTWRGGQVYVPLFCGFGPEAIAQRLNAAEVDAVVVDARWRPALELARPLLARDVLVFTVTGLRGEGLLAGDRNYWSEVACGEADAPASATTANDPAVVMFTSGTTSIPKACVIAHGGLISLLPYVDHVMALGADDVLFGTADPGWSFGLLTTGAAPMARGVMRVTYTGDFDAEAWFDVIEAEQVTALTGTPIRDGYGQTEVGMMLADLAADGGNTIPGSLASVIPGWEARLVDAAGETIDGPGEGEILIRRTPFQLTSGYANAADLWAARWRRRRLVRHERHRAARPVGTVVVRRTR